MAQLEADAPVLVSEKTGKTPDLSVTPPEETAKQKLLAEKHAESVRQIYQRLNPYGA